MFSAHCLHDDVTKVSVLLKDTNKNRDKFSPTRIIVKPKQWIRHEKYNPKSFRSDIAIIQLPVNIPYDKNAMPAYVYPYNPTDPDIFKEHFAQKTAKKAGWGRIGFQNASLGDLRHTEVTVMSWEDCKKIYLDATIHHICTRSPSADKVQVIKYFAHEPKEITMRKFIFHDFWL
jgi:hypothetical protein